MGKVQKMGGSVLSISANCLGSSQQGQVPTGQVRAGKGSFSLTISAAPTGSRDLGGVPFVRLDLQQTKLGFSHRMREFPHSRSTSWSWSESGALCWPLMSSERRAYGLAIAARPLVAIFQNHMNSWNPGLCWRSPVCSAPVMPVLLQGN